MMIMVGRFGFEIEDFGGRRVRVVRDGAFLCCLEDGWEM